VLPPVVEGPFFAAYIVMGLVHRPGTVCYVVVGCLPMLAFGVVVGCPRRRVVQVAVPPSLEPGTGVLCRRGLHPLGSPFVSFAGGRSGELAWVWRGWRGFAGSQKW
jgi:hypothetical protein